MNTCERILLVFEKILFPRPHLHLFLCLSHSLLIPVELIFALDKSTLAISFAALESLMDVGFIKFHQLESSSKHVNYRRSRCKCHRIIDIYEYWLTFQSWPPSSKPFYVALSRFVSLLNFIWRLMFLDYFIGEKQTDRYIYVLF